MRAARTRLCWLAALSGLWMASGLVAQAHAQTVSGVSAVEAAVANPEVKRALPQAQLAGSGRLTFLGFHVYDSRLWVEPGFRASAFTASPFVLELLYARDFTAEAIAERSIREMRRFPEYTEARAAQWQAALQKSFPDVKAGDRIAGVYQPDAGVVFLTNGRQTGDIRDPAFARLFFSIWLAPQTSEPALRQALLSRAQP